jgi:serine/threonine protein kinase
MITPYQHAQVSFKKLEDIGVDGEQSKVYRVHDNHLDADLAIKEIKTDGFNEEVFFTEAQMLYKSSHPNVVPVLYACKDATHIFIAMPYYAKGSLRNLAQTTPLTVRQVTRYAVQFLSGLNNVHSKGLIHFDIKPDNILLSDNDEALLSDFGFTKGMDEDGFASPAAIYTHHLPPEVTTTSDLDNRSDIYQVGLTLYRLLVGDNSIQEQRKKFDNGAAFAGAQKTNRFPDHDAYLAHIPNSIKRIVKKCLHYVPGQRYNSVIALLNDLAQINGNGLDWVYSNEKGTRCWDASLTNGHKLRTTVDDKGLCRTSKCQPGKNTYRNVTAFFSDKATEASIHETLMSDDW